MAITFTAGLTGILFVMLAYLFVTGVGVWGLNNPVGWGWAIVNFVFWVGIGHAGTLISAILFLLRQKWRTSINRFAEAMTIFAVVCAGIFPGIHVGRVWLVWWLFPLPNYQAMWPNFRSPLLWDVFAVGTYATVSLLFWYMGMIPDLATLRDVAVVAQRQEMVRRIHTEIEGYVVELGQDGRLLSLQLTELVSGLEGDRVLLVQDYVAESRGEAAEHLHRPRGRDPGALHVALLGILPDRAASCVERGGNRLIVASRGEYLIFTENSGWGGKNNVWRWRP